jgi:L-alanine-DL-glutamate epimerase-like enolase superfamily enzyme
VPFDRPVVSTRITIPNAYLIVVRLRSDEGHEGVGFGAVLKDTYAKPLATLIDGLRRVVVGMDPTMCEDIWKATDKAMFKAGPVGMSMWAVAAVDVAVWDLFAKIVGQPLYRLLGGRATRLPTYPLRGLTHHTFKELQSEIDEVADAGYKAVKLFVSGLIDETGPAGVSKKLHILKEQVGSSVRLGLDNQDGWTPSQAIQLGRMVEDLDLFWFEEPVDHRDTDGIAAVAAALDTPVCSGESLFGISAFKQLIAKDAADVIMIDVRMVGGITPFRKVAAVAEMWHRPAANHMMTAIDMHVMACLPNAGLAEYVPWSDAIFDEPIEVVDGELVLPEGPGLGCTLQQGVLDRLRA